MVGCCGRFRLRYIKHARLVNNCYPKKEGQMGPLSAELSYLTFYASSRPAKLTKVGTYLCQNVKRDIRKGRKGNNKVSVLILKALIQSCNRDLGLFCRSTVVLLTDILDTRDMDLIDAACDTFYVFCSYYNGANLGVDPLFTTDYENIVKRFASFAVYLNDDTRLGLQMRYSGHRALAAIVNSTAIHSSDMTIILDTLIPPLLATIGTASPSAWSLAKSVPSIDVRSSVFALENLTLEFIQQLAAQTLSLLFSLSNGIGVRASLTTCKEYYTSKQKWWPTNFCESISELILHSIQPQYRYLMLMNVLYHLHQHVDMADVLQVDRFVGNVAILRTILTSDLQLMGIPVLELLTALYTLMMRSLTKTGKIYDSKPTTQQPEELKHYSVQHDLFESIVGLASQSYYANQWNDIISYIIAKLRSTSASSPRADDNNDNDNDDNEKRIYDCTTDHLYQQCSVRFLDIFQANAIKALENEPADANATFTVDIWTPGLEILYDSHQDIRLKFADALIHFLNATRENSSEELSCLYSSFHHGHPNFIQQLLKSIFVWSRLEDLDARDMMAIYQLLYCIPKRFDGYGVIRTLPFIFTLQTIAYDYGEGVSSFDCMAVGNPENPDSSGSNGDMMAMSNKSDCAAAETATNTIDNQPISTPDSSMVPVMPNNNNNNNDDDDDDDNDNEKILSTQQEPDRQIHHHHHHPSTNGSRASQAIERQSFLAAVTLEWMIALAKATSMDQLLDYVQNIKDYRQQQEQVPRLDLLTTPTADVSIIDDKDDYNNNTIRVTEWMDRRQVIEAILADGKLQDNNNNTQGVNLDDKLNVEWGSEAYNNQEKTSRIEIDDANTATNTKPRLIPATASTTLHQRQTDKSIINVENLKGALAAQLLGNEQTEDQLTPPIQDPSQVKSELNHLLSGLHSSINSKSTDPGVSLVNPPY